jgi:hypothetical protein
MVLIATDRSNWYSSSLSVCVGATTMDSPVWIPIGSTLSMLQTAMQLSRPSRTISYSISFQPRRFLFDQRLGHAVCEGATQRLVEIGLGLDGAAALTSQGEAYAQHHGEADLASRGAGFVCRAAGTVARGGHARRTCSERPPRRAPARS